MTTAWCDPKAPRKWSHDEIRDYYDKNPNETVRSLASLCGKTEPAMKRILMEQ